MLKGGQVKFQDYAENLRHALLRAKFREYLLCFSILVLAVTIYFLATHKMIALIPYGLKEKVEVSINKVSPQYLVSLALSDVALYFNYDPVNVNKQAEQFLQRVYPSIYGPTQVKLLERNKEVIKNSLSQVFYPEKYFVQEKNKLVNVQGHLVSSVADKIIKSETITVVIKYYLLDGYAYIQEWLYHA